MLEAFHDRGTVTAVFLVNSFDDAGGRQTNYMIDLPGGATSGLSVVQNILTDVRDIHFSRLTSADVVRHTLVGAIVDAYTEHDQRQMAREARRPQQQHRGRR